MLHSFFVSLFLKKYFFSLPISEVFPSTLNKYSLALIIEQAQESIDLAFNELQAPGVVAEPYISPGYTFPLVLLLLVLEHMLVEVVLQVLVCIVDAQLLKAVAQTEILETEYVQNACKINRFIWVRNDIRQSTTSNWMEIYLRPMPVICKYMSLAFIANATSKLRGTIAFPGCTKAIEIFRYKNIWVIITDIFRCTYKCKSACHMLSIKKRCEIVFDIVTHLYYVPDVP